MAGADHFGKAMTATPRIQSAEICSLRTAKETDPPQNHRLDKHLTVPGPELRTRLRYFDTQARLFPCELNIWSEMTRAGRGSCRARVHIGPSVSPRSILFFQSLP